MDTARSLPAREPALPGESLASLLRRTAASMGYEGPGQIRQLLSTVGKVPWNVNHIGPGPLIDYLAVLLRTQPDDILALTVHRFARTACSPRGQCTPSPTRVISRRRCGISRRRLPSAQLAYAKMPCHTSD